MNDFVKTYVKDYELFYKFTKKLVKNDEIARDVLHNVYFNIAKSKAVGLSAKNYILKAIQNQYFYEIKLARNVIFKRSEGLEAYVERAVTEKTPQTVLERKELVSAIYKNTSLNRKQDTILRMKVLQGMTYAEIAAELNANEETTKSHITTNKKLGRLDWLKNLL